MSRRELQSLAVNLTNSTMSENPPASKSITHKRDSCKGNINTSDSQGLKLCLNAIKSLEDKHRIEASFENGSK